MRFPLLKTLFSLFIATGIFLFIGSYTNVSAATCAGADLDASNPNINTKTFNVGATVCMNGTEYKECKSNLLGTGWGWFSSSCTVACKDGDLNNPDTRASCSGCVNNSKTYKEGSTYCVNDLLSGDSIYKCDANAQQVPTSSSCPYKEPGDISTCLETYDAAARSATAICATPTPRPTDTTKQCKYNGVPMMGNESKCDASGLIVLTCDRSNSRCDGGDDGGICLDVCNNIVAGGGGRTCVQHGSVASCDIPTPTPTATTTPTPTATPPPAAGVTCSDGHNAGDIYCERKNLATLIVWRCNNDGATEKLGYCSRLGSCNDLLTPGQPVESICTGALGGFSTVDPADAVCNPPAAVGQRNPQVGLNCGIPQEEPVLIEDGSGNYIYKVVKDDSTHKCCYSNSDGVSNSLTCLISTDLPGLDTLKDWFFKFVLATIDRLPAIWDTGPGALTIGNLRGASNKIEACRSDAAPLNGKTAKDADCFCGALTGTEAATDVLCGNSPDNEKAACIQCIRPSANGGQGGIWSGLGCIVVESESGFVQRILALGVSIGGTTSLLCLMYGAFLFQTSRGSPDGIKKARDLITSCLTGLLMIIFSVFILRLIGYTILRIPGFGP